MLFKESAYEMRYMIIIKTKLLLKSFYFCHYCFIDYLVGIWTT